MARVVYDSEQRRHEQRAKSLNKRYLVQEWRPRHGGFWINLWSFRWLWCAALYTGMRGYEGSFRIIDTTGENDGS